MDASLSATIFIRLANCPNHIPICSWMVTVIAELQVPSSPRISRYCGNCSDGCVAVGDHFHSLGKLSEPESTADSFSQSHNSSIPNGPRGATDRKSTRLNS